MSRISPSDSYARTRRKLGYTHYDMGRLLGVQHTTSIRWENGVSQPPAIVDALMIAIYRNAIPVATFESWMAAARKTIEGGVRERSG